MKGYRQIYTAACQSARISIRNIFSPSDRFELHIRLTGDIFAVTQEALDKSAIIPGTFYVLSSQAYVTKWKVCGDINSGYLTKMCAII